MIELTARIGLSLLVVFGLLWLLARLVRGPAGRAGRTVTLLGRQQLGRGSAVAVVRVGDRALVLGVTEQRVSLLAETDLAAVAEQASPGEEPQADGATWPRAPFPGDPAAGAAARPGGLLGGSALSPATWRQALDVVRDRTVRRS